MASATWLVRATIVVAGAACHPSNATAPLDGSSVDAAPPAPVPGVFGLCASGWKDTPFAVGTGNPFLVTGCASGDAAVIQVGCLASNAPTAVAVTSDGWTITQLGSITGSVDSGMWAASFGTIVPAAEEAWFTVHWEGAECARTWNIGDDLRGVDSSGGAATFDAHAELVGAGNVTAVIQTNHANDIVWFGAASRPGGITGWPSYGFGMSDGDYDWTFYKYTSDPANTIESLGFTNESTNTMIVTAVSVRTP